MPDLTTHERQTGAWAHRAACKGVDPAVFHPQVSDDNIADHAGPALTYCHGCPVRHECLEHALLYEPVGIWGGTTGPQRVRIRAAARIATPTHRDNATPPGRSTSWMTGPAPPPTSPTPSG